MEIFKGTILGLGGTWMSGLAHLRIRDERRGEVTVHCDNGATVRALESCVGDVIGDGHTINNKDGGHIGREVYYSTDNFGILEAFTPVDDANPEMVRIYEEAIP
jgi:hypothetical protein